MWKMFEEIKEQVLAQVIWAEKEFSGKSGEEKRKAVVQKLDDMISLPESLEWIDGPVIGLMVDSACYILNWVWGHKWNVEGEERPSPPEGRGGKESLSDDMLSEHFSKKEFACKCGCGEWDVDPQLVKICEGIRTEINMPLRVNSGRRCKENNTRAGGVPNSYHTQGKAADLSCALTPKKLFESIKKLYEAGKLPGLEYCKEYDWGVHIDTGKKRKNRFAPRG